jgi:hypothetical protein
MAVGCHRTLKDALQSVRRTTETKSQKKLQLKDENIPVANYIENAIWNDDSSSQRKTYTLPWGTTKRQSRGNAERKDGKIKLHLDFFLLPSSSRSDYEDTTEFVLLIAMFLAIDLRTSMILWACAYVRKSGAVWFCPINGLLHSLRMPRHTGAAACAAEVGCAQSNFYLDVTVPVVSKRARNCAVMTESCSQNGLSGPNLRPNLTRREMLKIFLYFTFKFQNVHLTRNEIVKFKLLKVSGGEIRPFRPLDSKFRALKFCSDVLKTPLIQSKTS